LLFHAGERNGTLWDFTLPTVITAKRIRNPCSPAASEHEAEKDPSEFTRLIRAVTREGDVVFDPFAGRARWVKEVLRMNRHVILADVDGRWLDRVAVEDFCHRTEVGMDTTEFSCATGRSVESK
jgi:hypothetical protein